MANFGQQMQRWVSKTKKTYRQVIFDAFVMLGKVLIERTPVGDPSLWKRPAPPGYEPGRLVNNYFASLGSPLTGVRRVQDVSGTGSLTQIKAIAKIAAGKVAYIVNPTPYAKRIEFAGWSSQAPAGMVRLAAAQFPSFIRQAARANR